MGKAQGVAEIDCKRVTFKDENMSVSPYLKPFQSAKDQVILLFREGKSQRQIGDIYFVSYHTVGKYLQLWLGMEEYRRCRKLMVRWWNSHSNNIDNEPTVKDRSINHQARLEKHLKELVNIRKTGRQINHIAVEFGVSYETMRKFLRRVMSDIDYDSAERISRIAGRRAGAHLFKRTYLQQKRPIQKIIFNKNPIGLECIDCADYGPEKQIPCEKCGSINCVPYYVDPKSRMLRSIEKPFKTQEEREEELYQRIIAV
jgi:DNA-binding NarL/FixJ family response regulator